MKQKWLVLLAASLGFFLVNFDGASISILLPTLQNVFNAEFYQVQWVWIAGLITLVVTLAITGRLGDTLGKKTVYLAGSTIYLVGTLLAANSPSILLLAAFRIIQALGLTAFLALGAALITENFEENKRGLALGLLNLFGLLGILAGPIATGALLQLSAWNTVYWIKSGLALVTLLVAQFCLPAEKVKGKASLDLKGAASLFIGLGALALSMTLAQEQGFTNPLILGLFVLGAAGLVAFVRIEQNISDPMILISFFKKRNFSVNLTLLLFSMIALNGYGFLLPFYIQNVLGLSTIQMGLIVAGIFGLVMALTAPIGGAISDRIGSARVTLAGIALLFIGTVLCLALDEFSAPLSVFLRLVPVGVGIGLLITPTTSAVMGTLPPDRLGMGSSIVSITINIAQTMGIAILGTYWAERVRILAGSLPAGGASATAPATQAAALRSTFLFALLIIGIGLLLNIWFIYGKKENKK